MTDELKPKDRAEQTAVFRAQVIAPLVQRVHAEHGELAQALRDLSTLRFTPPGASATRYYQPPTIERWYYAFQKNGLDGLRPKPRSDRGHAQAIEPDLRDLLLEIKREHEDASVSLIRRTLIAQGRMSKNAVSEATLRRLYAEHGLDPKTLRASNDGKVRRRWEAEKPGVLWHADVCHGPSLTIQDRTVPLRIHAILDDASRAIMAILATSTEREVDMLALLVQAIRRHGAPTILYLDNGSTYRGDVLATACARLDISLIHAKPYDPRSRGKMERWWRTLRSGCLDHIGTMASLHDVQVRLLAFVEEHYHRAPHAGLLGKSPGELIGTESQIIGKTIEEEKMSEALTVRAKRRILADGTIGVGGIDWEIVHGFLAGRKVVVARTLFEPQAAPWIEFEGKEYPLRPVNAKANANRPRKKSKRTRGVDAVSFDPTKALLDRMLGRSSKKDDNL
jgi:transposase InsO family protein